jgi:acetyl esterase/lipase
MATQKFQYGPNSRQTYDVYGGENDSASSGKHWLVYIHGGYFRAFSVTSTSVQPSIRTLESENPTFLSENIAGIASLNYRLSGPPGVQDPASTPPNELQRAKWPDHLDDVLEGLRDLDRRYNVANRYVISGHSVGAQIAFIAALQTLQDDSVPKPVAILGISGIYDYPQIHSTHPSYITMTKNAMDPKFYEPASPARHPASAYGELGLKAVVLAHSHDDGLVTWDQVETMDALLQTVPSLAGKTQVVTLKGVHDSIWEGGVQLAMAFVAIIDML